jgi:hypothetical protein
MPGSARLRAAAPLAAPVLIVAAVLWFGKPQFGHEWWVWADPDGAYLGNSLNLLIGNPTSYLDHPGLPTQDALAVAFGAWRLGDVVLGDARSRDEWMLERMLDLNGVRPVYFGLSLLYHVGGALLAYVLMARLLGHWTWGLAGGLLFVAAPKLVEHTYNLRPDTAVAALSLAVAYLLATALERESPQRLLAAAFVLGFAVTMKLVALGLVVPVALAALVLRPREWLGPTREAARRAFDRHRLWLVPVAVAWLLVCVAFNRDRLPLVENDDQRAVLVNGGTFLVGFVAASVAAARWRIPGATAVFAPFHAALLLAAVAGLALPATLVLDDGLQMVVAIWETLTGGRANENVVAFADFELADFTRYPLLETAVVLAVALVAGAVGIARRCWWPALTALGALVLALMAAARLSEDYYYAPAFAVAIPGALWLVARRRGAPAPVYVWVLVAVVFLPLFRHPIPETGTAAEVNGAAQRLADELLAPGEVIVTPPRFPVEDLTFSFVEDLSGTTPEYPRRFVELGWLPQARERGLVPRFYVARGEELTPTEAEIDLGEGPVLAHRLPRQWGPDGSYGVVELSSPPS